LRILYLSFSAGHTSQAERLQRLISSSDFKIVRFGKDRTFLIGEARFSSKNLWQRIKARFLSFIFKTIADAILVLYLCFQKIINNVSVKQSDKLRMKFLAFLELTAELIVSDQPKTIRRPLLRILGNSLIFTDLHRVQKKILELRDMLDQNYDFVIFAEENFLDYTNLFFKEIDKKDKKKIVVQYTYGVKQEWLLGFNSTNGSIFQRTKLSENLSREMFPNYVNGNSIFPVVPLLVLQILKINPEDIWSGYIGQADEYLLDSSAIQPPSILPADVARSTTIIEPVEVTLNLQVKSRSCDHTRNVVAIFLPPNQVSEEKYQELIYKILTKLKNSKPKHLNFEIYAHPRISKKHLEEIERRNKIKITHSEFSENIHSFQICVLFSSALFRIFDYLNIPIINWDIYEYNYEFPFSSSFVNLTSDSNLKNLMEFFAYGVDEEDSKKSISNYPSVSEILTRYS